VRFLLLVYSVCIRDALRFFFNKIAITYPKKEKEKEKEEAVCLMVKSFDKVIPPSSSHNLQNFYHFYPFKDTTKSETKPSST
jgi:hypothetical protein